MSIGANDELPQTNAFTPATIYISTLVVWVFAIVTGFWIGGPQEILNGGRAFKWQKHDCIVETAAPDTAHAGKSVLVVTVRYEIGGHAYATDRRLLMDSREELQRQAKLFFRPGDTVGCRINPRNPAEMVLEQEYVPFDFFLYMSVMLTALGAAGSVGWCWWIRRDKSPLAARFKFYLIKVGVLLVLGFGIVMCGIATVNGFGEAIQKLKLLGWSKVNATIQVSKVTEARAGESWDYRTELRYSYDFAGRHFEGTRWGLFDDDMIGRVNMRKALGRLKAGDKVPCYVNPENPALAILHRSARPFAGMLAITFIWTCLALGFWMNLQEKRVTRPPALEHTQPEIEPSPVVVPQLPIHLQYKLNRRQRLVPHLKVWAPYLMYLYLFVGGTFVAMFEVSFWLFPLFLFAVWFARNFLFGLLGIVLCSARPMDVVIEKDMLGFIAGRKRYWMSFDGILGIEQLYNGTWTIYHHNGSVVNIPALVISEAQVKYIRDAARRGKTPEGMRAVIERGRKIQG